jgi:hypothetical protein
MDKNNSMPLAGKEMYMLTCIPYIFAGKTVTIRVNYRGTVP